MGSARVFSRDLTSRFVSARTRKKQPFGKSLVADEQHEHLLRGDTDIEMGTRLPPEWIEHGEEAKEDLKAIEKRLDEILRLQQKRLLAVFGDDQQGMESQLEAMSADLSVLVRRCEQRIQMIGKAGRRGATEQEQALCVNMQRSLATQLQSVSTRLRKHQQKHIAAMKEQDVALIDMSDDDSSHFGFTNAQLLETERMEEGVAERERGIKVITKQITELNQVFKELAVLVIDQGTVLDRIDYNLSGVVEQSHEANAQLQKAVETQRSGRAFQCIVALVIGICVLVVLLVIKYST